MKFKMFTILVILAVFSQIAIALSVYYRRRGNTTNLIFMFLTLALAAWAFTNYLAISVAQNASTIYAIRTVLSFVVIQNTLFYLFAETYPNTPISKLSSKQKLMIPFSLFVIALTQSPFLFQSITIKNGTANPNPGPVIIFFVINSVLTIAFGLRALIGKFHRARGQQKEQLRLLVLGSIVLWVIVPLTNFAITLSAKTTLFVRVSPFYTLLFAIFITYAIVAQRLFDIRAVVARSVAYILLLVTLGLMYGALLFGLSSLIFTQASFSQSWVKQLTYVVLGVFLAFSFQPIKQFFDRLTNRLFYRDAYDEQAVLNEISEVLTTQISLQVIMMSCLRILGDNLKVIKGSFIVVDNSSIYRREQYKEPEITIGPMEVSLFNKNVLVSDELEGGEKKKTLEKYNVGVSVRLVTQKGVVGYLLFGHKQSGNIYTTQDIRFLEIVGSELAIAVQNALRFEEIESFNITLQEKVDTATRKLRQTNDKLRALDEAKDEFISMASHQLRTPLTSVKGYISMVLEGDAGKVNGNQQKLLNQAFVSSQRMVYLIADLLNVSRLRTGKFVIERKPTQLAEVIETELSQLTETAKGRGLELTYDKPKDFPMLMLDETKTRQVIMNFADNAIYYTQSGANRGHIRIGLEDKGTSVEFTVTDDGIGVPKDAQHHLFTKFYRAGNAQHARPDGTGLGLFMAKKVIVAQGGAVIFHSEEGKGSTFGFSFPKSQLQVPEHLAKPTEEAKPLVKKT